MNDLGRKLTALEQIAEDVRRRQLRDDMRDVIVRRARVLGWTLSDADLERDVARAVETALYVEPWLAGGMTMEDAGRRLALERGYDPDRFLEHYRRIKAEH